MDFNNKYGIVRSKKRKKDVNTKRRERFNDRGGDAVGIKIHIDIMMARRKIGLTELAGKIDITPANLSILKNNKAKAVRFSTLEAICRELECQPGDIIEYQPEE